MQTPSASSVPDLNTANSVERKTSNLSQALRAIPTDAANAEAAHAEAEAAAIQVRPIQNNAELEYIYRLCHDVYAERGYCAPQPDGRLVHYPHLDGIAQTTVLVALIDGEIVGTNSFTLDGPQGLHVDSDFRSECDAIRREGRALGASWRIATRLACRSERNVVMALIQETVRLFVESGVQTSVFTFNPRHERIYQRLLNMKTIARSDGTHGLNNAPAVLMRLDVESIPERWLQAAPV